MIQAQTDGLPDRLQVGCPDAAIAAYDRNPKIYARCRHYPIRQVRNAGTRNLAHGVYDLHRERGFLENAIRVREGQARVILNVCEAAEHVLPVVVDFFGRRRRPILGEHAASGFKGLSRRSNPCFFG
jgi:hypothetical protein